MARTLNVKIELLDGRMYNYKDVTQVDNENGLFSVVYGKEYIYSYPLSSIRSIDTEVITEEEE